MNKHPRTPKVAKRRQEAWMPRRQWIFCPRERLHASGKHPGYDRAGARRSLREELDELPAEVACKL